MTPYWTNGRATLYQGHVLDVLAKMESQSVHMAATSPPYWGLRDYGIEGVEWPVVSYAPMAGLAEIEVAGCEEGCAHVWADHIIEAKHKDSGAQGSTLVGTTTRQENCQRSDIKYQYCQLCGGWRGSLGLEPTVEMYVGHLVLIFRELKRVLRDDATFWLNLGDSYSGSWGNYAPGGIKGEQRPQTENGKRYERPAYSSTTFKPPTANCGLKPKDLIGIPWRVALALQADGWWLRSDIIWAKGVSFCPTYSGSCMPESVRDRPTSSYEHVLLLAKSKRYFYDGDAVREQTGREATWKEWAAADGRKAPHGTLAEGVNVGFGSKKDSFVHPAGRNLRAVWTINPGNYPGSHFATFPPKLVEPMIRAGTSAKGCCPECGASWVRVLNVSYTKLSGSTYAARHTDHRDDRENLPKMRRESETTGWIPTCSHYDKLYYSDFPKPKNPRKWAQRAMSGNWFKRARKRPGLPGWPIEPATVLDPFAGTATTLDVAIRLGRRGVGIELSKAYCDEHIIPRLSAGLQMELAL